MRKLAKMDELYMLMIIADSEGIAAATRVARRLGFTIAQEDEQ